MSEYPQNGSTFATESIDRVIYRWAKYKPDGARQMGAPGRWQRQVWRNNYFKWENCEPPTGVLAPIDSDGPITQAATFQNRVRSAHLLLFSDDPTDIPERVARFFEEAIELAQAFNMSPDDMNALVERQRSRPAGKPEQEVGGVAVTLASLCCVADIDLAACAEEDLRVLTTPEKIAHVKAKRATRHGRGPLPGFDPT